MTGRIAGKTQGHIDRPPARTTPSRLRRGFAAAAVVAAGGVAAGATLVGAGDPAPEPLPATTPGLSDADRALANRFADREAAGNDASLSDADRALRARFTGR